MATDASSVTPTKKMKPNQEKYEAFVARLAKKLNIICHPNPAITLKAIHILLERSMGEKEEKVPGVAETSATDVSGSRIQKSKFTIDDIKVPIAGNDHDGDDQVDHAIKVLKLLYLDDLRSLQTRINDVIVMCQAKTARSKAELCRV